MPAPDKAAAAETTARRAANSVARATQQWHGLVTNSDPHDLPAGAAVNSRNAVVVRPGELRARLGTAVVRFDR